ncbi:MAG TPA: hypothetical protein VFO76_01000 [Candidatus Kapabacteria bacterium]|nr:hypothetical protein [Candidatus Kapabacteria bacterium]
MKTTVTSFVAAMLVMAMTAIATFAQPTSVNGEFTLQGRLTTTAGTAVANGMHQITVNIYQGASSNVVFTQTDSVMTIDGVFSLLVGAEGLDSLHVVAGNNYSIGVSVDNAAELSPRLRLSSVLNALTADIAANAEAVGGFHVSPPGNPQANSLLTLNGNGHINTSLLDTSDLITSINGLHGHVVLQTGNGISLSASGNILSLNFTGSDSAGAAFSLPFLDTVNLGTTALGITNTLAGNVASFVNTGTGTALNLSSTTGAALTATTSSSANATLDLTNNSGMAIDATANTATAAALKVQNLASSASAQLINGVNAAGNTVLDVLSNGQTTINATVGNALNVTTSASGEAAVNINGGIKVNGPAGTGQIAAGNLTATITNAFAKANSIIMITPTGGVAFPLAIASQGNGSFVVSVVSGITSLLTNASFNYLIINQ